MLITTIQFLLQAREEDERSRRNDFVTWKAHEDSYWVGNKNVPSDAKLLDHQHPPVSSSIISELSRHQRNLQHPTVNHALKVSIFSSLRPFAERICIATPKLPAARTVPPLPFARSFSQEAIAAFVSS
ncbi:uncharacterized protein LY79DRAFT_540381 [Colletotrichum navitas]|uniref:Uncharacterized protein n=1 Tax=Colletotrichum navitas TaxID=681940 RepID=A0AAD8Q9U0_9PEZI|nr:uncharacterized protein LY79DRAFT_540381 [Colletotrichum navitas]KAK1597583.1 hypothetical protein LY79DRAFT_540381 [Colletotrichum navitas]